MEKELNQQEIDAMVKAARGGGSEPLVTAWDYKQAGRLSREQLEAISTLHEAFARNLTNSIGAYLRIGFQAGLASAEHLTYREFLGNVPERSYLGSVKLAPFGAAALIQMDIAIAFPLIEVLLGGEGVGQAPSRETTEIEEQILETVMRIICRELQAVWQPLGIEFLFEQRQHPARVQHLMPVEEKILALSFEVNMKDCRGLVSVALPAVISNALLRKISAGRPRSQARLGTPDSPEHLRQKLMRCPFRFELELQVSGPSAGQVATLRPGMLLPLNRRADGFAELVSGGQPIFQARVARLGSMRAAQVTGPADQKNAWRDNYDQS